MPLPQKGATHFHAQLGLPDKGRAIKGLILCYVVWLRSKIYRMSLWTFSFYWVSTKVKGLVIPWEDFGPYRSCFHILNCTMYMFYLPQIQKIAMIDAGILCRFICLSSWLQQNKNNELFFSLLEDERNCILRKKAIIRNHDSSFLNDQSL